MLSWEDGTIDPDRPSRLLPYHVFPPEVKQIPGPDFYYTHFCEKAFAMEHIDGENIVILWPRDLHDDGMSREVDGWAVIKLRKSYEHLGKDHPRIVQYVSHIPRCSA